MSGVVSHDMGGEVYGNEPVIIIVGAPGDDFADLPGPALQEFTRALGKAAVEWLERHGHKRRMIATCVRGKGE